MSMSDPPADLAATQVHTPPERLSAGNQMALIIALGLFCTTFGQTQVLGGFPLRYLLKDHFHMNAVAVSGYFLLSTLAWYLKPFAGVLSDCFPIAGTKRRSYMLICAVGCVVFWLLMGAASSSYPLLVAATMGLNLAMVIGSVVSGGLLVEQGQAMGATGRLSSIRMLAMNGAGLIGVQLGAWMIERTSFQAVAVLAAASFVPLWACSYAWLRESQPAERDLTAWNRTVAELKELGRARLLWATALMWALVKLAPGFGTVLFFHQSNDLHMKASFLGNLSVVAGITGIITAAIYFKLCRQIPLRVMLTVGIAISALSAVPYLVYAGNSVSPQTALLLAAFSGVGDTLAALPLFDMAARSTPRTAASLGYALLMSVGNYIQQQADVIGSKLHDTFHWSFAHLVWLNAGSTAIILIVIPFLPVALMAARDE